MAELARWPSKSAVVFAAVLALSEGADGQSVELPDTGDLEADLKQVMRETVAEFADPSFDRLIRAVNTEIANDADLAAEYREKLSRPLDDAKKARLRMAERAGQLPPDTDLDLFLEMLYAPLFQRWLHRSGPLTETYADALVEATLRAFGGGDGRRGPRRRQSSRTPISGVSSCGAWRGRSSPLQNRPGSNQLESLDASRMPISR